MCFCFAFNTLRAQNKFQVLVNCRLQYGCGPRRGVGSPAAEGDVLPPRPARRPPSSCPVRADAAAWGSGAPLRLGPLGACYLTFFGLFSDLGPLSLRVTVRPLHQSLSWGTLTCTRDVRGHLSASVSYKVLLSRGLFSRHLTLTCLPTSPW